MAMTPKPNYQVWPLPDELTVQKKRPVNFSKPKPGNNFTLRDDIKEWVRLFVKDHWYLTQKDVSSVSYDSAGRRRFKEVQLVIHFRSAKDAVAFKLAWL
jgi:hypothetical protein